jgi:CheY-like chemotaxis protein
MMMIMMFQLRDQLMRRFSKLRFCHGLTILAHLHTLILDKLTPVIFSIPQNFFKRFMDVIMPELDGLDATRKIREIDKITPIVALTANATTDDRDECFQAGMSEFITKPVSLECLRDVLIRIEKSIVSTVSTSL